jgi:hypothetical protein
VLRLLSPAPDVLLQPGGLPRQGGGGDMWNSTAGGTKVSNGAHLSVKWQERAAVGARTPSRTHAVRAGRVSADCLAPTRGAGCAVRPSTGRAVLTRDLSVGLRPPAVYIGAWRGALGGGSPAPAHLCQRVPPGPPVAFGLTPPLNGTPASVKSTGGVLKRTDVHRDNRRNSSDRWCVHLRRNRA